jgi:hypothetical protein
MMLRPWTGGGYLVNSVCDKKVLAVGQVSYRGAHSTQHTAHSTQYTAHSTQYTVHSTQHTAHSTQYTVHTHRVEEVELKILEPPVLCGRCDALLDVCPYRRVRYILRDSACALCVGWERGRRRRMGE